MGISASQLQRALKAGKALLAEIPNPIPGDANAPPEQHVLVAFLDRASHLYSAMCHLVNMGRVPEAAILGRSLFEVGLYAQYIVLSPPDRTHAFAGHEMRCFFKWYDDLKRLVPEKECLRALERTEGFQEAYAVYNAAKKPRRGRRKQNKAQRTQPERWPDRFKMAERIDKARSSGEVEDKTFRYAYRLLYHDTSEIAHCGPGFLRKMLRNEEQAGITAVHYDSVEGLDHARFVVWSCVPFLELVVKLAGEALGLDLEDALEKASAAYRASNQQP